jgi:TnpA family transposase
LTRSSTSPTPSSPSVASYARRGPSIGGTTARPGDHDHPPIRAVSYSDVVFGLLELLGISYRPALADLPDQKGWRIKGDADYGPLNTFARGKVDLAKIRRNWEDILRVVASIYTGTVRAYDVVRMLQRDGHPTALGEAIAMYGRIPKTLHICSLAAEEAYRRDIKGMRNLQEGRHALAGKTFQRGRSPRSRRQPRHSPVVLSRSRRTARRRRGG